MSVGLFDRVGGDNRGLVWVIGTVPKELSEGGPKNCF